MKDHCPHCGKKLSAWEQVLLNVDRALICKNCWYRIIAENPIEKAKNNELPEIAEITERRKKKRRQNNLTQLNI